MSIAEKSQTQLDYSKYSAGVFIDLKKAFDIIDHNILLEKTVNKTGNNLFQKVVISQILR